MTIFIDEYIGINASDIFYRFGLCGVDVTELVRIFDAMRLELRSLVPSALIASRPRLTSVLAFPSHP